MRSSTVECLLIAVLHIFSTSRALLPSRHALKEETKASAFSRNDIPLLEATTLAPSTSAQLKWQSGIYYHGGGINVGTTLMYNIYYGDWTGKLKYSNPAAVNIFNTFGTYIGKTSWFNISSTYWDNTGGTPTNVLLNGWYFVNSTNYKKSLTAQDISDVLTKNIKTGAIFATPGFSNNIYNFIASEDVQINGDPTPAADCTAVCGYHTYVTTTIGGLSTRIKYTVSANVASSPTCQSGCTLLYSEGTATPNGNFAADAMIAILAHEVTEAITDTARGWRDNAGDENADKCVWQFPGVFYTQPNKQAPANIRAGPMNFLVQSNWVNYGNGCCSMSWPFATGNIGPNGCPFDTCC